MTAKVHDITTVKKTSTRKRVGMLSAATIILVGGGLLIHDQISKVFPDRDRKNDTQKS